MEKSWVYALTFALIIVMICNTEIDCSQEEDDLIDYLLTNYSYYVRPVQEDNQTVFVYYHLKLSRILKLRWKDAFLTWDPKEHNNLTQVHISSSKIWIPDTVLYETADVNKEPGTGVLMTNAVVDYTGDVFWAAPAIFTSSCKLDITYFPFDEQKCPMTFGPWTYTGDLVQMKQVHPTGDYSMMSPSGQWQLLSMPAEEHLLFYNCCPQPFSDITFTIYLRRKALFYLFNLLTPAFFMSFVSLIGFYMPGDSGEKVGLNITVMLSLIFSLLLGATLLPPTSDTVSMLGNYFAAVIVLMAFETAISVFVLNIHHHDPESDPPKWLYWLLLEKIGPLLIKSLRKDDNGDDEEGKRADVDSMDQDDNMSIMSNLNSEALGNSLVKQLEIENESVTLTNGASGGTNVMSDVASDAAIGNSVLRIGNCLTRLAFKAKRDDGLSQTQQDWVNIGIVIERVLLIAFAIVIVATLVMTLLRMNFHF
ncbi:neuronal acetylcholine receptor subunit alpha-10-like [Glandiceps talaboti]